VQQGAARDLSHVLCRDVDPFSCARSAPVTRGPGRPATISRVDVVGAALRLARQIGLDRFTMGQLADELGVAPMTAYHHVANRTELVQLVVEELLNRVEIPGPDAGPWDVRLKVLESNVRRELGGIPGIRTGISPEGSEASQRLADAVLAILAEAGFDESTGLLAYGALFTYMVGQLDLDVATERGRDSADALRFAELTQRTPAGGPTPDEYFEFGFDLLLCGLRDVLRPTSS
jgi:AcrR family transcriptional regulator